VDKKIIMWGNENSCCFWFLHYATTALEGGRDGVEHNRRSHDEADSVGGPRAESSQVLAWELVERSPHMKGTGAVQFIN